MTSRPVTRRRVLAGIATLGPLAVLRSGRAQSVDPFALGVASGCPRPERIVLWTRLVVPGAPQAIPDMPVPVEWELAEDEQFRRIAARGTATAEPRFGHSVHVEPDGLSPSRWYWYRFRALGAESPVGRTRTASERGTSPSWFRFAFASCQMYEHGHYAAYRHMAAQDLDLVVHLGDYIYELSWGNRKVRRHEGAVPTELWEFRDRYALYKGDPHLRAAHAAFPWLAIWDDHEVSNDHWRDGAPNLRDPALFRRVRAAAYQAWWEHMPVPASMAPVEGAMRIHERYRFGDLLDLMLLDCRQHRSPPACRGGTSDCDERTAADRTMLGAEQEAWLDRSLGEGGGRWTILAQPTLMAQQDRRAGPERAFRMDGWDGYPAARGRLLSSIHRHRPPNPVVIGGDVHAFWVADLKQDFDDPSAPTLASELVGSSISSEGPAEANVRAWLAENPHLKYGRGDKRGYVRLDLDPRRCRATFLGVDDVANPTSNVEPIAMFTIEDGKAGAMPG
ncbi:MAG: alkaline phosphatase [Alphaproteobacteria bacterium]